MSADENLFIPEPEKKWRLGFWSLIATQFQGAFNDNGLKFFVIFLILGTNPTASEKDLLVFVIGNLFALPFILFSMAGGYLADRYSKRSVAIGTKIFEIFAMIFAMYAFWNGNSRMAFAVIFLASTQAAFFGPAKYGLLPEVLPAELLSWGNGILELTTFLAIIAGAVVGPILAQNFHGRAAIAGLIFGVCSLFGLATSFFISRVPPADPSKKFRINILGDLRKQVQLVRPDRVLHLAIAGNTYFWFLGALLQFVIVFYGREILHLDETRGGYLQAALAIGIGVGSYAAGLLSSGKIEYGLIPLGAIGMSVFALAISFHGLTFLQVLLLLGALGFAGGFFVVPVNALIQHRPEENHKGSVIAFANFLSFVGVIVASAIYSGFTHYLHVGLASFFLWTAFMSLAATAYVLYLLPDSLLRLLLWIATNTLYRLDVVGRENVPARGGALLTPNHVSMADAVLLIASIDRPIRFLMFRGSYEHPLVKPFAKIMGVIPIASDQGPRELIHSLRMATDALKNGEIVCIFPEGQMTRVGQMLPFRRGMERIIKGVDVPIVPVNLDGVWGSIFSFAGGRFLWKFPRQIPYPVRVTFGKPLPPTASAQEVRRAVQDLGAEAFARRKKRMHTLPESFIYSARRHPFRFAMADGQRPKLSWFSALAGALVLARRLRKQWQGQEMVGILLPPSVPGALVNYAAMLMGKVPVNLNYTVSNETLASCAQQCNLKTIVSARVFLEKVKIQPPGETIFIEDVANAAGSGERVAAALAASLLPAKCVAKFAGSDRRVSLDDIATIIFSSGSTGDPKGVILTHYNIASNVEQLNQVFMLNANDRIMGILPFFHSFGFTGTLCLPAATGIGVVFHPNPLDSRVIGALVNKYAVTMLLATPTFLNAYTRRCTPEEFGSLRFVLAGAEKLPDRISQAFEDHFGIRPHEGYGCTECSPAVTVNTIDFRAASFRQVGAKRGSIGHPLPGITVKIVDPDTLQPVDVDGFIRITDRLSRFSKIGGEMVPHIKVEDLLQELAGVSEQTFVVTAIPDEKKGERLVVLHTLDEPELEECLEKLGKSDLPALWRPRKDQFVRIENLPYLGTGKLDLRKARGLALEMTQRTLHE